jgi:ferritin
LTDKAKQLIQAQAQNELSNFLTYEKMYLDAESIGLFGLAKFCKSQAQGEKEHHDKIIEYINDAGIQAPVIVAQPRAGYQLRMIEMLSTILAVEKQTTDEINAIMAEALQILDFQTFAAFEPLAMEQIEEIKVISDIITKYQQRSATGDPASAEFDVDFFIGGL